jgi:hypothetical protein
MNRYCIVDGCREILTKGARCSVHALPRHSNSRAWQKASAEARRQHVARYGWTCPGWGRTPHYATDLTADHPRSLAEGGPLNPTDAPPILCRSCNSRKGAHQWRP